MYSESPQNASVAVSESSGGTQSAYKQDPVAVPLLPSLREALENINWRDFFSNITENVAMDGA